MSNATWPTDLPVVAVRMARQTDQLEALRRFYCEGLGLTVLSSFTGHAGFDGLILGLPDHRYQLEFVQHEHGSPGTSPNHENLLVFYLADAQAVAQKAEQLQAMGYAKVPAANPWWEDHHAITIEDPDGWRVVLFPDV